MRKQKLNAPCHGLCFFKSVSVRFVWVDTNSPTATTKCFVINKAAAAAVHTFTLSDDAEGICAQKKKEKIQQQMRVNYPMPKRYIVINDFNSKRWHSPYVELGLSCAPHWSLLFRARSDIVWMKNDVCTFTLHISLQCCCESLSLLFLVRFIHSVSQRHALCNNLNLIKFDIYNVQMRAVMFWVCVCMCTYRNSSAVTYFCLPLPLLVCWAFTQLFNSVGNDDNSQINNQQNHHHSSFVCKC